MTQTTEAGILDAVFASWERGNAALINLVRAMPPGALQARAAASSPTVGQMLAHLHHERLVSVLENAPEAAGEMPKEEWARETDVERVVTMLTESCARVRAAVTARIEAGKPFDKDFSHPV